MADSPKPTVLAAADPSRPAASDAVAADAASCAASFAAGLNRAVALRLFPAAGVADMEARPAAGSGHSSGGAAAPAESGHMPDGASARTLSGTEHTHDAAAALSGTASDAAAACFLAEAERLAARFPWFGPGRVLREILSGRPDPQVALVAPWRVESSLRAAAVDVRALTALSSLDVIDRFLREEDLRIVAGEGEPVDEVVTEARLDDEDELVSEELAEIYLAQGLRDKAIAIYRKLSLRNPEKSVYFAALIGKLENNN